MRIRFALLPLLLVDVCRPAAVANAQAPAQDPLAPVGGGVTAEHVATRALASSYQVEAARGLTEAASARSDQAAANFVPRITVAGRYTRLSYFTPRPLFDLPGQI